VSAEVFRSEHEEGPWRRVHAGLIYRLGTSDDRATRNPAIELPRGPTRFIRIDIAPKGGGMDGAAPFLEPSWVSERLYFIQQGEGPHTLVYGKFGAPAARFTTPQLLAATRRLLDDQRPIPSTATLGPRVAIRGKDALEPETAPDIRTLLLWGVLLASVAIVATLAMRLVREMRKKE
ncbi:MAG: DUF3999 domain-containing protein, partial [bacterium]|nr:DUF3999 domain-containing protein [bacterium]